jgi:hypothetical protein
MRFLAGFLLIGVVLGAGCTAPSADTYPDLPGVSRPFLSLPAGFSDEGVEPRRAAQQRSRDIWVVGSGTVERLLRDDTKRPRHQRFVVRAASNGPTLLFAHNVDLSPRVPVKKGDVIAFRGRYVWNDQGGVVHWTHRDRRDKNAGGWIVWKGQNFR